ncbi:MAG: NifU family protein [Erysipelotrichia bacterium]|jgi:Fe-S cluster biogenesis protein NfuA|nr:NifU family protein [Bacilli bacterium]NLB49883.1 NifU family protein [Erysipelotrichia bacterium]
MEETEKLILATLDKIRPFLRRDGGDIEFLSFEDGIVYVKMHGACEGCAFIDSTLKDTIEVILTEEVPGVIEVRNV